MMTNKNMIKKKEANLQMKVIKKYINVNYEKQLEKNSKNKKFAGIDAVKP
jgi:hypothetical protein